MHRLKYINSNYIHKYIYTYIYNHCHIKIAGEYGKKCCRVVDPAMRADPARHGMPQISTIT